MAARRAYMDHNATSPLLPAARAAMLAALDLPGNPSSVHAEGRAARAAIETARAHVARLVGAAPAQIVFTSGGTEAANLALRPDLVVAGDKRPFTRLIASAGEHACVLQGHRFEPSQVTLAPLTAEGAVDLAMLERQLATPGERMLVALQAANNETGVVQPVRAAADLVHAHGGALVCDAVQAAGRIEATLAATGADLLFISAHKIGGPKGVGALAAAHPATHIPKALIRGGGQEKGLRAGTENVAGIAGFGAAAQAADDAAGSVAADLRDALEDRLLGLFPELTVFGRGVLRLPNTSAFALAGVTAETALIALDLAGFAVSSGSACSSGKVQPSHVLAAMGVAPELARGAIRVSLGAENTRDEVEAFVSAFARFVGSARGRRNRAA